MGWAKVSLSLVKCENIGGERKGRQARLACFSHHGYFLRWISFRGKKIHIETEDPELGSLKTSSKVFTDSQENTDPGLKTSGISLEKGQVELEELEEMSNILSQCIRITWGGGVC